MTNAVNNQYTQQITTTYNQKIDQADDKLQGIKDRMAELEKNPLVAKYKNSPLVFVIFMPKEVREYQNLQKQLPGIQASTDATIAALKNEMAQALKVEQEGSAAVQEMIRAGELVSSVDIGSMDLEAALMMVQMNRANQLETQLKDQITEIQNRNKQIAEINNLLATVRNQRPSGEKDPEGKISASIMDEVKKAGVELPAGAKLENGTYKMKQSDFDKIVENLKGKIDSLNSTQQMDMIRMQSLTNKRNEAFEIMTNFISKMAKTRESVVGNMR